MQISDAEWEVMQVIWTREPRTAAEVIESLSESRDWNHRTIRTLLARLVEKGVLTFESDGLRYIYRAAVTRASCIRQRSQSFLSKVFGGDVNALLAHFVEDGTVSKKEMEELSRLLVAKKNSGTSRRRKP